jgi:acyl carrier protein
MEQIEIIKEVNQIFIDTFEDESIILNENTTANDIELWDSLNHIHIITAVEKHYKINFELNDLLNFNSIGDLCKRIKEKMK